MSLHVLRHVDEYLKVENQLRLRVDIDVVRL